MILLITSFLIIFITYIMISKYEGNFINVFFPSLIIFLPANYILIMIYYFSLGINVQYTFGFVYVYLCYTVYFVLFMLSYRVNWKLSQFKFVSTNRIKNIKFKTFSLFICFFILAFILYLPIMIKFRKFLFDPRNIYIRTRSYYGIYYFTSLFFLKLSFLFSLLSLNNPILKGVTTFLIFLLAYFHGSKSSIVSLLFIYIIYKAYYVGESFKLVKSLIYTIILTVFVLFSFWLTFENLGLYSLLIHITRYSDYTRNAIKLIDNYENYFDQYYYGKLLIEDNTISIIPRVIYPDKPRDFGSFKLDKAVYPSKFALNVGSPSFGLVGRPYADFGIFAIIYLSIIAILRGMLLKWSVKGLKKTKNIFYFISTLYFSGVNIISVGVSGLFWVSFLVTILLIVLLKLNFSIAKPKSLSLINIKK